MFDAPMPATIAIEVESQVLAANQYILFGRCTSRQIIWGSMELSRFPDLVGTSTLPRVSQSTANLITEASYPVGTYIPCFYLRLA
jgi:hypothetical protein